MDRVLRPPTALLWPGLPLLYLLLPGHPQGLLSGLPLRESGLGLGLLVVLAAWWGSRPRGGWARWLGPGLGAACLAKLLIAALALPGGLLAYYSSGADPLNEPERSTEWRLGGPTRVDLSLDLVGDQFPVHFFNDLRRFNFFTAGQPRRDLLPFSAAWRGWLLEPRGGERCLVLQANGSASLRLGERHVVTIERSRAVQSGQSCGPLASGSHPLELRYSRPEGEPPYLRLLEVGADGVPRALGPERFARAPAGAAEAERHATLGLAARGLDLLVVLACLAVVLGTPTRRAGLRLERLLLAGSLLIALAEGLVVHQHFAGRTPILSGGNDWLAYESYARDALLNGPLVSFGRPLGQGETFYYQPLYIFYLAALHALLGESLHLVLVAQYVSMALAGVLTYYLARELFGRAAAWASFGLFWALRYLVFNQTAGLLLSENLVVLLVPAMLLLLARWQRTWRRADLLGAGALLGLAILTRSTPLVFLPPAMALVALAQWRKFRQWRPALGAAAALFAVTLAVTSLVAVRNYVVAGRPALLPESASANLWEAHRPSARVDLRRIERDPLYNRLNLDRQTREVLEFARQDPAGYGWSLAVQGLYALGLTGPALGTSQAQWELLALSGLYLLGLAGLSSARRSPAWLLHAFVATHFLQMMVFMAHQYGFRLPLPMYGPMLAVAGAAVAAGGAWLAARAPGPAGVGRQLGAAVLLAGLLWGGWELLRPRDPRADVLGLGGAASAAARATQAEPAAWSAERLYFDGPDGRSFNVGYLPGLAYRPLKWHDPRVTVWPGPERTGVLASGPGGAPARSGWCPGGDFTSLELRQLTPGSTDRPALYRLDGAERCPSPGRRLASLGGLVELLGLRREPAGQSGQTALLVAWRVIQRPSFASQLVVEALDRDGQVAARNDFQLYPSGSWEPGEVVVARVILETAADGGLAVGFTRGGPNAFVAIDDPLPLYGQTRYRLEAP